MRHTVEMEDYDFEVEPAEKNLNECMICGEVLSTNNKQLIYCEQQKESSIALERRDKNYNGMTQTTANLDSANNLDPSGVNSMDGGNDSDPEAAEGSCKHVLCGQCIDDYILIDPDEKVTHCPFCREEKTINQ